MDIWELETERLRLRKWRESDWSMFAERRLWYIFPSDFRQGKAGS